MASEVIMPALGMAQDTGRLVAWLKSVGDSVSRDDPLMEVETDKSTMEVPAGAEGVLAETRADPGDDVPVGQVIAVIAAPGESVAPASGSDASPASSSPRAERPPEPAPAATPPASSNRRSPVPAAVAAGPDGKRRVLASPKARRLAGERGIDLARLVAAGLPEPLHVADLDRPEATADVSPAPKVAGGASFVTARADAAAFDDLLDEMAKRLAQPLDPHALLAGLAAAAMRDHHGEGPLVVGLEVGTGKSVSLYLDPDRSRPTRPRRPPEGTAPHLRLRDMTQTRITGVASASDPAPSLTLGREGAAFTLMLAFAEDVLPSDAALALADGLARRLENPLEVLV